MHPAVLLIELGAVILGLGLLGAVSVRFSISPIPLYLLAGLAFGQGGILPLATSDEFIAAGAEIGVILLLFTLGLEYTAAELVGTLRSSASAGLLDLVANSAPGVAAGFLLGWGPVAAVALGGITYVTSSGITAKVLGDLGWLGNRETPVVLSLLVFEDLMMAVYLPILTALLAGAGLLIGSITLAISAVTLLVAGLAQQLQVSAAVGAFLVGIALSGPLAHTARELLSPLRDLFAAARLGTTSITGRLRAGCALTPRGEFTIVIAGLAVAAGINPRLGPLAAAYVLILAVAGPLVARAVEPLTGRMPRRPHTAHRH